MPGDQATDSLQLESLFLPYNPGASLHGIPPRLVDGKNAYITSYGTITRRPGLIKIQNTDFGSNYRPYRLWIYETLNNRIYILCSAYKNSTSSYCILYNRLNGSPPGWQEIPEVRSCNGSSSVHELVTARGLAFIRYTHHTEKQCSVIFDGSLDPVRTTFWGIDAPQPVAVYAKRLRLNADVNATATSWQVSPESNVFNESDFDPSLPPSSSYDLPYEGVIDDEVVTVTAATDAGSGNATLTVTRGVNGTKAAEHKARSWLYLRKFGASLGKIETKVPGGWQYCSCYETLTGHLSSRSNTLHSQSLYEVSYTERFLNQVPRMYLDPHPDTVNVPYLVVGRTSDGGGTFLRLARVPNLGGTGKQQYLDDDAELELGSGPSNTDPVPDSALSIVDQMPSTVSNGPPPMVNAPLTTGVDTPVQSGRLTYYAGRIWMPVENVLHFSSNEEVKAGVPEECWRLGVNGNFFRMASTITNQESTNEANYIFTRDDTYVLTGVNATSFSLRPKYTGIGAAAGHPAAIARTRSGIVWMTQDYRVMVLTESTGYLRPVTDALKDELTKMVTDKGAQIFLNYYSYLNREWIVVTAVVSNSPSQSRVWVLDLALTEKTEKPFWNVEWGIPAMCTLSGRVNDGSPLNQMIFAVYTDINAAEQKGHLAYLDMSNKVWTDDLPAGSGHPFEWFIRTCPFSIPPGNHVNALREPGHAPALLDITVEETAHEGIWQPVRCILYRDRTEGGKEEAPRRIPAHTEMPRGYTSYMYESARIGKRVSVELRQDAMPWPVEVQSITIRWAPESGGSI